VRQLAHQQVPDQKDQIASFHQLHQQAAVAVVGVKEQELLAAQAVDPVI
jgi:hypothetical protein